MAMKHLPPHVHLEIGESLHRIAEHEYVVTDGTKMVPLNKKARGWETLEHAPLSNAMRKKLGLQALAPKPRAPSKKKKAKKGAARKPAARKTRKAPAEAAPAPPVAPAPKPVSPPANKAPRKRKGKKLSAGETLGLFE